MSGEFDPRKDSHSIKLEGRPQIFVKLSFRELCGSKLSGSHPFDNMTIINWVKKIAEKQKSRLWVHETPILGIIDFLRPSLRTLVFWLVFWFAGKSICEIHVKTRRKSGETYGLHFFIRQRHPWCPNYLFCVNGTKEIELFTEITRCASEQDR